MVIPKEAAKIAAQTKGVEAAAIAEVHKIETEVEAYEKDLITFVTENKSNCIQLAIIVAIPVGLALFELGRIFHR